MKRYVKEKTVKSVDNENLQIVQVYESRVEDFTYLVFVDKRA